MCRPTSLQGGIALTPRQGLGKLDSLPRDKHDRLLFSVARGSVPDPMDPVVAEWVFWPEDAPFAACATHDIDRFFTTKVRLYQSIQNFKSLRLKKGLQCLVSPDPSRIGKVVDLDRRLGITSTFFLMSTGYKIDRAEISSAREMGFEFALHASYEAHLSRQRLVEEKRSLSEKMGSDPKGVRHHYLRFREPDTWMTQRGLFLYDSTLAWQDQIGYRGGRAYPFETGFGIWEVPLAVMDVTVFNVQRIGWSQIKLLVDKVAERRGLFTYLWHNDSLTNISATRPWLETYVKLTRYLLEKGAWFATAREVVEWASENWEAEKDSTEG